MSVTVGFAQGTASSCFEDGVVERTVFLAVILVEDTNDKILVEIGEERNEELLPTSLQV